MKSSEYYHIKILVSKRLTVKDSKPCNQRTPAHKQATLLACEGLPANMTRVLKRKKENDTSRQKLERLQG